jgi:serine protease
MLAHDAFASSRALALAAGVVALCLAPRPGAHAQATRSTRGAATNANASALDALDAAPALARFVDRGRVVHARRLGRAASGRERVALDDGQRRYEAELGAHAVVTLGAGATDADLAALGVAIERPLMPRARLALLRSLRGEDALALAARLAGAPRALVETAAPDLWLPHVRHFTPPPDDPRYGGQWYLDTLGIEGAWARATGDAATTIAIVDDGCDLEHPDLAPHLLPGFDALDGDDVPAHTPGVRGNAHGTACAGLVAAVGDNAEGIVGACPECTLRCIRLLPASGGLVPVSADVAAFDAILRAGVAVASNSWGFASGVPAPGPLVTAIETTLRDGRGGLGTVVVFAAGNDDAPIGADEVQATPGVICVGAINQFDEAAAFSNRGPSVSLVAPTGTLTTDVRGADGDDPSDYTARFGGTSSACPLVAGVAALLASARPDASAADIRDTLLATTRPAPFATPDATGHDPLYGRGILDPTAALARWLPEPADAGPPPAAPAPPAPAGCACRVAPGRDTDGTAPAALATALLALGLAARRRARRRPRAARHAQASALALVAAGCAALAAAGCAATPDDVTGAPAALRPDSPGTTELPPRYDPGDVVEFFDSAGGGFRVHFTRSGTHAVPADDADADGIPDHVTLVADTHDAVRARYEALGFLPARSDALVPDGTGGSERFDVYLLDFGGSADGAFRREICAPTGGCAGYMVEENDFAGYGYPTRGYAVRLLASHEFFHAIQAAYDRDGVTQGAVLSEGTAVWASERFDPGLRDLEGFAAGYLERTDRPLGTDPLGPVPSFAYGAGIFFEHLSTRHGDGIVPALLEALADAPAGSRWTESLDALLAARFADAFEPAFLDFAARLVFLGPRADDTRGLPRAAAFPGVTTRVVTLPFADASLRLFPASARYFEAVATPGPFVVRAREGDAASGATVLAYALARGVPVAEARGLGEATLEVPATADSLLFALADGRPTGASRVLAVCAAQGGADACATPVPDAGTPDAGTPDAGTPADAAPATPPSPGDAGCSASRAGTHATPNGLLALLLVLATIARRTARRRDTRA